MFKKILIPIDLQDTKLANKAVKVAIEEAIKHSSEIFILTVIPGFGMPLVATFFPDDAIKDAVKEVAKQLKKYVGDTFPDSIPTHSVIADGNPAEKILKQAKKIKADLIIIPSHNKSISQVMLGSCAAKVVGHANCSVMVIKG